MILLPIYIIAAGIGAAIALLLTRSDEMRHMRLAQLIFMPSILVMLVYCLSIGGIFGAVAVASVITGMAVGLARPISHLFGIGLSNFLDNYDWTPLEEELALRPIRVLIDKDNYRQALGELEALLQKHKPTYEAVLLKIKLLHHIGRVDEAVAALPGLIALSNSPAQQLSVMELLEFMTQQDQDPPKPAAPGTRRIEIHHELVLFQMGGDTPPPHKVIPPGAYEVAEIIHGNRRWLKLAGEDWGNAEVCWEAILTGNLPPPTPPLRSGVIWKLDRMYQSLADMVNGKSRRQLLAESQQLFSEAKQFIHREDWQSALPLLQKASACDPERYEIAYRWALAVRHTANDDVTAQVVSKVLQQSQWSKDEQDMLKQLTRPLAR